MIDKSNFKKMLLQLGFFENGSILYKEFDSGAILKVDFKEEKLIYPIDKGFIVSGDFTTSFNQNENFVVFECVHRLFQSGYKPEHIELEPKWTVGHGASGGRADIMVKDNSGKSLLMIECKTAGKEFEDEWKKTLINGGQIFSYAKQAGSTQFICLYTTNLIDDEVKYFNYIIALKDNEKLLEELSEKKPLSYQESKILDKEDIFKAWKETYSQDYATVGIFEEDIRPYEIGKTKYSLKDLSTINSNDIQGKYHEFATILRQHNVSGRENAFDKLVNLFLCKIVDETNNPKELKFHWKGIAYDSFFDLQDRLQKLYQEGMKRFLGEDVTYIDNEAIDDAFRFFKNDPDATRETIKSYFRELKFFTNNDFAFIDVHNEKLFYQNSAVLLKIVQMLQDIRLKTEEQNQFLGDMFEGFLDQGVKQSEGQFFTPMPIVKFILKSLPLKQIVRENEQIPKVIDYACGAGHFLNEYAQLIMPIVEHNKEINKEDFLQEIVGIEKEYRLSKVAKVSAFMYGQDDIDIIYSDALATNSTVKDKEYSVLVANPPYSVKGFLETLSDVDRRKYELLQTIDEKSYSSNNSIEAFFIERAKQLLKPGGVAGIIVPSSILTKGKSKSTSQSKNVYVATREILLKYFDIVAIADLGSGTFGKTGTNTVTLFLRRKKENPAPAEHYWNRVTAWFEGKKEKDEVFEDEHFLIKYCNNIEIDFENYKTLLEGTPNERLLATDLFKAYKREFDKWAEVKKRKNQKAFKNMSKHQQKADLDKRYLKYVQDVERDKLYYFVLASLNPQKVLIVNSPSTTTEMKKFLGYEWSSAKGREGIKYLGGTTIPEIEKRNDEDEEVVLEEDDKRVLNNIFNLNNINTPLYDPEKINNPQKINYLISQNFKGENFEIPEGLDNYVSTSRLVNLLDFSKPDFNKSFSLIGEKILLEITSKYPVARVESLLEDVNDNKTKINENDIKFNGKYPVITQESDKLISGYSDNNQPITDLPLVVFGDHTFSFKYIDFKFVRGADGTQLMKFRDELFTKYFYHLSHVFSLVNAKYERNYKYLKDLKIPVPPKEVQEQIVEACESLDEEKKKAEKTVIDLRKTISEIQSQAYQDGYPMKTIESVSLNVQYGINDQMNTEEIGFKIFRMNEVINGYMKDNGGMKFVDISKEEFKKYKLEKGDILFNRTNSRELVGKTGLFNLDGDYCFASYLVRVKVNPQEAIAEYVNYMMNSIEFLEEARSKAAHSIKQSNINANIMKNISIPVPLNRGDQEKLVKEIAKHEEKINEALEIVYGITKRKEEIMNYYL